MENVVVTLENNLVIKHSIYGDIKLGDTFWSISKTPKNVYKKCSLCGGEKKLTVKDYTFGCPKCGGQSTGELYYTHNYYSLSECKIDEISFSAYPYVREGLIVVGKTTEGRDVYAKPLVCLDLVSKGRDFTRHNNNIFEWTDNYHESSVSGGSKKYMVRDRKLALTEVKRLNKIEKEGIEKEYGGKEEAITNKG